MRIQKYKIFPIDGTIAIRKLFTLDKGKKEWFDGDIIGFDAQTEWYKVKYRKDNDVEDLDWYEIYALVNNYNTYIRDKNRWEEGDNRITIRRYDAAKKYYANYYIKDLNLETSNHDLECKLGMTDGILSHDHLAQTMVLYQTYIVRLDKLGDNTIINYGYGKPCAAGDTYCKATESGKPKGNMTCTKCKKSIHLCCIGKKKNPFVPNATMENMMLMRLMLQIYHYNWMKSRQENHIT